MCTNSNGILITSSRRAELKLEVLREVFAHVRFHEASNRPNTMDEMMTALDAYWKWVSAE